MNCSIIGTCICCQPNSLTPRKRRGNDRSFYSFFSIRNRNGCVALACFTLLHFAFETVLWPPFWRDDTPICFSKSLKTLSWNADGDHVSYTSVFAASLTKVLKSLIFLCVTLWIRLYYLLFHVNKAYYNISKE